MINLFNFIKKYFQKLFLYIQKRWAWLSYLFIFVFVFVLFLFLLAPNGVVCPDSFYHAKLSLLMEKQGVVQDFPWTQYTTYRDLFVDHHFGYHWILVLFFKILPSPTDLDPLAAQLEPLLKLKIATAFLAGIAFAIIYWFLRRNKVKASLFWVFLVLISPSFLIRISLMRAPVLAVSLLVISYYLITRKKYLWLMAWSFVYVWMYGTWPLLIVAIFFAILAQTWHDFLKQDKKSFKSLFKITVQKNTWLLSGSCFAGLLLGLTINPYFPKTFPFYWFQTVKIGLMNYQDKISVGAEWYPPQLEWFYTQLLPILIPWAIGVAWTFIYAKKQKVQTWFFLFLSIFFLFFTLKSQRNIEYLVPPMLFFSALVWQQIIRSFNWQRVKNNLLGLLKTKDCNFYFISFLILICSACFFFRFYWKVGPLEVRKNYQTTNRFIKRLQGASNWIRQDSQPGDIVFHDSWDVFPELFYFNSKNYYINGLDQTFMYARDPLLYQFWTDLITAKTPPSHTALILREQFNAKYVLSDGRNDKFKELLEKSRFLEKVFEDEDNNIIVYKVNF